MSIREINKKLTSENAESTIQESDNYGIKIQCPDCTDIFILNEYGQCYCRRCNRLFSEDEVRARCGL